MKRLTKKHILLLHEELIKATGGLGGLRDEGLLDSALNAPYQTFDGIDPYPSLQQKAARLCYGLVKNHPFIDGNKRTGAHAMLVFLSINSVDLFYKQEELVSEILALAAGKVTPEQLTKWICEH